MNDISKRLITTVRDGSGAVDYKVVSETKAEAAQAISETLLQLRRVAQEQNLGFLAYLLEMAFREAFMTSVNLPADAVAVMEEAEIPAGVRAG